MSEVQPLTLDQAAILLQVPKGVVTGMLQRGTLPDLTPISIQRRLTKKSQEQAESCRRIGVRKAKAEWSKAERTRIAELRSRLEHDARQRASKVTPGLRKLLLESRGCKCEKCGAGDIQLHVHHKRHREHGGTNAPENLVLLCEPCHRAEHQGEPVHKAMVKWGRKVRRRAFGISRSTVHRYVRKYLPRLNKILDERVSEVLAVNVAERHVRGGAATKQKYRGLVG